MCRLAVLLSYQEKDALYGHSETLPVPFIINNHSAKERTLKHAEILCFTYIMWRPNNLQDITESDQLSLIPGMKCPYLNFNIKLGHVLQIKHGNIKFDGSELPFPYLQYCTMNIKVIYQVFYDFDIMLAESTLRRSINEGQEKRGEKTAFS